MPGASISGKHDSLVVKGRQKLKTEDDCVKFNEQLIKVLGELREKFPSEQLAFEDFDISQNPIPGDQLEAIFATLSSNSVQVQRMKLFGCPTLDDTACSFLAQWLKELTPETALWELHLSDCAITTEGFSMLMAALEENSAIPSLNPKTNKNSPIYLRLEGNYIDPEAIKTKVEEEVLGQFTKNVWGSGKIPQSAKAKLAVNTIGDFKQNEGEPPAPENAPAPKQVWDWQEKKMQGKGGQWDSWQQKGGWQQKGAWQQDWTKGGKTALATSPAGGKGTNGWKQTAAAGPVGKGVAAAAGKAKPATILPAARMPMQLTNTPGVTPKAGPAARLQAQPKAAGRGAADRSRTPAPRPMIKPPAKGLPPGWSEQWSEEYCIPFYWHEETGESSWEKPAA